ncbi:cytochrome b N-terminal domain-containing protein, partial [Actinomadura sp. KC345]|uniref:cytochrome b N-terminal domain-containing protein n=1 Tax=Actinomadura sp. KC345 TaxID=2530371 RepID=UPI001FB746ED
MSAPGDRFGSSVLRKAFPDHWSFLLGELAVYSFAVILLTGAYLALFFVPSLEQVTYDGSYGPLQGVRMSEAYASTLHIGFDVRGSLMRGIHHWAAVIFTLAITAHLVRGFFTGAFRRTRSLTWLIGIALLMLVMLNGLFGHFLPDDLRSGTGLRILEGALASIPFIGSYLATLLSGGEYVPRLYLIHVLLIPAEASTPTTLDRARRLLEERNTQVQTGLYAPCPTLAHVHEGWLRARVAARTAAPGETRDWTTLGALRLLHTAGDEALTQTTQTQGTTALRNHPALAETARTYLDLAANVQQTAQALNIHRQTLYHRLRRIEAITTLSLTNGQDRLTLHLALT